VVVGDVRIIIWRTVEVVPFVGDEALYRLFHAGVGAAPIGALADCTIGIYDVYARVEMATARGAAREAAINSEAHQSGYPILKPV
jgi:hypothetical protein